MTDTKTTDLPEAATSATVKVKSSNNFEWLFTMRGDNVKEQMEKIQTMEKIWLEKGWTPLAQNNYGAKPVVATKPCPLHKGQEMKERESKKYPGKKFYSHSQGVYPNMEYCMGQGFPSEKEEMEYEGA